MKKKINKNTKKSIKFSILVVVFIVLVVSITMSILFTKYQEQGLFSLSRKKFDVVFTNVVIDNDNTKVKLDKDNNSIHIEASKIVGSEEVTIDIKNIANIDAIIKNYSISNVNTNAGDNEVTVEVSLDNREIIKKGETKKLIVNIKNNTNKEDIYYNFNINYLFEEYNL